MLLSGANWPSVRWDPMGLFRQGNHRFGDVFSSTFQAFLLLDGALVPPPVMMLVGL